MNVFLLLCDVTWRHAHTQQSGVNFFFAKCCTQHPVVADKTPRWIPDLPGISHLSLFVQRRPHVLLEPAFADATAQCNVCRVHNTVCRVHGVHQPSAAPLSQRMKDNRWPLIIEHPSESLFTASFSAPVGSFHVSWGFASTDGPEMGGHGLKRLFPPGCFQSLLEHINFHQSSPPPPLPIGGPW